MRTKEEVRKWTQQRWTAPKPLPTLEEIKRQLGHGLQPNNKRECAR